MNVFEKIMGTMLGLVFVYLLLSKSSEAGTVIGSISGFSTNVFKTLQGR